MESTFLVLVSRGGVGAMVGGCVEAGASWAGGAESDWGSVMIAG